MMEHVTDQNVTVRADRIVTDQNQKTEWGHVSIFCK